MGIGVAVAGVNNIHHKDGLLDLHSIIPEGRLMYDVLMHNLGLLSPPTLLDPSLCFVGP